jgi:hypothetical protein
MENLSTDFLPLARIVLQRHVGAFREIDATEIPFGAELVAEAMGLAIKIMEDRGDIYFEVAGNADSEWFPIQFLAILITGEKASREKVSVGKERGMLDKFCALFAAHAQALRALLAPERVAQTKARIKDLSRDLVHPLLRGPR